MNLFLGSIFKFSMSISGKEIPNIDKGKKAEYFKKEITEDHITTLEYLLNNIEDEYIDELKEILNLIIKK